MSIQVDKMLYFCMERLLEVNDANVRAQIRSSDEADSDMATADIGWGTALPHEPHMYLASHVALQSFSWLAQPTRNLLFDDD